MCKIAKTKEDLENSRKIREKIISKYGSVPTSIWKISFAKNKLVWDPRTRQGEVAFKDETMDKELQKAFSSSGRSVRGEGNGQSTLPYDMIERVIKFYSEVGDTLLEPTMGDPTGMTATYQLGRNFIGYDISEENFEINRQLRDKLLGKNEQKTLLNNDVTIDIYKKSSENMSEISSNSCDVCFFSPPYWDTEYYGNEPEQLGIGKTYEEFIAGLGRVIKETYRCLKPGKYCAININDFRKKGKFYDFHMDVAKLMDEAGYKRHDTIIIVWPNCIGQCFASQIEERKTVAKGHEYIIVGKKEE